MNGVERVVVQADCCPKWGCWEEVGYRSGTNSAPGPRESYDGALVWVDNDKPQLTLSHDSWKYNAPDWLDGPNKPPSRTCRGGAVVSPCCIPGLEPGGFLLSFDSVCARVNTTTGIKTAHAPFDLTMCAPVSRQMDRDFSDQSRLGRWVPAT